MVSPVPVSDLLATKLAGLFGVVEFRFSLLSRSLREAETPLRHVSQLEIGGVDRQVLEVFDEAHCNCNYQLKTPKPPRHGFLLSANQAFD